MTTSITGRAPRSRRVRLRSSAALGAAFAATLLASACGLNSPVQSMVDYPAADGIRLDLGDVQLRNVAVVATEEGGPGTLIGHAVNNSATPLTLQFGFGDGGAPVSVTVPAGADATISTPEAKTTLAAVPGKPGDWARIAVSGAPGGQGVVTVPILSPKDYLKDYAPAS